MSIFMYDDVMIFMVVLCYSCYVCNSIPIHIVTLSCYLITHISLGTSRFTKLYKKSSHIYLSVNHVLFISCISLGGVSCTNLENKALLCLIVKKHIFINQ
jgi:hypothetical protein